MKRLLLLLLATVSLSAGDVELLVDAEGVHRQSGGPPSLTSAYRPEFDNGGGVGVGLNWFFTGRVSLEVKAAVLATEMRLRTVQGDFVGTVNVGSVNMIPVTALVQWHPFEEGSLRPYVGAGVAHIFVEDIDAEGLIPRTEFSNPTGLVVDGGLRLVLSDRWSLTGDARYVPIETSGNVRFGGGESEADLDVRPLVVGFGVAYRF
jgi:outer membrane protein